MVVALVAGLSLALVTSVIVTIMAVGGGTTVAGDERLRSIPETAQPFDTAAPAETGQSLVVQPPGATQPPAATQGQTQGQQLPGATQPPAVTQGQQIPTGQIAKVGETITVAGLTPEVQVAVTLNRIIDNATPGNQFLKPKNGNRFVAVELSLKNAGQEVYTDSPIVGAALIDAEGGQHHATLAEITEGLSLGGAVNIAVGDSRKGVIVFEVPAGAKPAKLQFGVMFGQQKGEWLLG